MFSTFIDPKSSLGGPAISTITSLREKIPKPTVSPPSPPLIEGHRLDQPTFLARSEAAPGILAQLIGGRFDAESFGL